MRPPTRNMTAILETKCGCSKQIAYPLPAPHRITVAFLDGMPNPIQFPQYLRDGEEVKVKVAYRVFEFNRTVHADPYLVVAKYKEV